MKTNSEKQQIVDAAKQYTAARTMSNNELAKLSGVNPAYLSAMFKGNFEVKSGNNRTSPIGDEHFNKLAKYIGYHAKQVDWQLYETPQYKAGMMAINDARMSKRARTIICHTGSGKTTLVQHIAKQQPGNTFVITCAADLTIRGLIIALADKLNVPTSGSQDNIRGAIQARLQYLSNSDYNPLVIFDEAENLKLPALTRLKALYDNLVGSDSQYCGMVLIGTRELLDKMKMNKAKAKPVAE